MADHEDNDMMLRLLVRSPGCQRLAYQPCDPSEATPCCQPTQSCLRHASSDTCGGNVSAVSEKYLCIPQAAGMPLGATHHAHHDAATHDAGMMINP